MELLRSSFRWLTNWFQTRYKRQPLFLYTPTNNKEPEMLLKVLNKTTWTSSQAKTGGHWGHTVEDAGPSELARQPYLRRRPCNHAALRSMQNPKYCTRERTQSLSSNSLVEGQEIQPRWFLGDILSAFFFNTTHTRGWSKKKKINAHLHRLHNSLSKRLNKVSTASQITNEAKKKKKNNKFHLKKIKKKMPHVSLLSFCSASAAVVLK